MNRPWICLINAEAQGCLMLTTALDFLAALWSMALGWRIWVLGLVVVNFVVPGFFPRQPLAWIIAGVFLVQAGFMMLHFHLQGFTRLLGLAHAGWIGLAVYLVPRLAAYPARTPFGLWLRIVLLMDGILPSPRARGSLRLRG